MVSIINLSNLIWVVLKYCRICSLAKMYSATGNAMNSGSHLKKVKGICLLAKVSTKNKNRKNNITFLKVSKDSSTYKCQYPSNIKISHNATQKSYF